MHFTMWVQETLPLCNIKSVSRFNLRFSDREDSGQAHRVLSAPSSFPFEWELSPALPRLLGAYVLSSTCDSVQTLDTGKCAYDQEDIVDRMQFIAIVRTMTFSFLIGKI